MISLQRNQASGSGIYRPTPEDIRRACEQIQATWSPRERAKRHRGPYEVWWMPPSLRLSGLLRAIREELQDRLP